jgi:hypothetical protein
MLYDCAGVSTPITRMRPFREQLGTRTQLAAGSRHTVEATILVASECSILAAFWNV